jgi:glycosyltransferase involved in cell wall biosynthesis
MPKKKNILQIIPNLNSGGVERCVVSINAYLVANGYKSFVLSNGGKLSYRITQSGGTHIQLNVATKNPIGIFLNIFKIRDIIEKYNIDLVDVTSRAPAWSAYFACKMAKCPLITTLHGNHSLGNLPFSFFKRLYNSSMVMGDHIICVSDYIKNYALENYKLFQEKYANKNFSIVHRGVDLEYFNPTKISQTKIVSMFQKLSLPDEKQILLLPGRYADWKGQLNFLKVLERVKSENYICLMVGATSGHNAYKNKIVEEIKKMGIEDKVTIRNAVEDMPTLYLMSSFVISSSIRGEAFGMVATEAQAMEKIIIATALGGSMETIIDGKTGWLVDVNDFDKFAAKIDYVLALSLKERSKIGAVARKHITDNFMIEKMCSETVAIYDKLNKKITEPKSKD